MAGMVSTIHNHAKDGGKTPSTKMLCVLYRNSYIESLKISNSNAIYFGKKFLLTIFSTISDFMDTSAIMEWTRWRPHCTHRIKGAD